MVGRGGGGREFDDDNDNMIIRLVVSNRPSATRSANL